MLKRIAAAAVTAAGLVAATVGPAAAVTPDVFTWSNDVDRPFVDCDGFTAYGVWTISHRLTIYYDASGMPIKDHEIVDFRGAIVNHDTGASVADSGRIVFFDTLNPDGSFATTMANAVRRSAYVHHAGRSDFQTGVYHGNADTSDEYAALCEALGG
jgi:hypothetical protein